MHGALGILDAGLGQLLRRAAHRPLLALLAILAVALPSYLAGFIELPPIDRTEVRYAQSSKQMIETGDFRAPRFQTEPQFTFPIGVYWAQSAAAQLVGGDAVTKIWGYRIPSLIGIVTALLITFFGARRLVGAEAALIGVILLAINPVIVLQSHLAVSKGLHLAFVVAAQWSLARIYVDEKTGATSWAALWFWLAQGFGILTGALSLPLLSLATIGGLIVYGRKAAWLARLGAFWGLPLALLVASPWFVAIAANPEPELVRQAWSNGLLNHLAGPQKVSRYGFPGMYSLGLLICMLSAALFLGPAFKRAWAGRDDRALRFLLIWVIGYLAVAEPFFNKPPLYTIQMLLPAVTALIGVVLAPALENKFDLTFHPANWFATLLQGLSPAIGLIALVVWLSRPLDWLALALGVTAAVCALVAHLGIRKGQPIAWLGLTAAAALLVNITALSFVLPDFRHIWSSGRLAQISRVIAPCVPGRVLVGGYEEPSAVFEIGTSTYVTKGPEAGQSAANWLAEKTKGRIVFVSDKAKAGYQSQAKRVGLKGVRRVACTGGFNVGRVRWTDLELYVVATEREMEACPIPDYAKCTTEK